MTRSNLAKLGQLTGRALQARTTAIARMSRSLSSAQARRAIVVAPRTPSAFFSTSCRLAAPVEQEKLKTAVPANINEQQYHDLADEYLENLLDKFEAVQDATGRLDVEYSSGVMTIKLPNVGEYVINKQPPNKQIWLSSPKSGPKRFDYVVISEDQSSKQDTATTGWVYLRDGTYLDELLRLETGVDPVSQID